MYSVRDGVQVVRPIISNEHVGYGILDDPNVSLLCVVPERDVPTGAIIPEINDHRVSVAALERYSQLNVRVVRPDYRWGNGVCKTDLLG